MRGTRKGVLLWVKRVGTLKLTSERSVEASIFEKMSFLRKELLWEYQRSANVDRLRLDKTGE